MKKAVLPSAICLTAILAAGAPAFAADYFVVVPVPAKTTGAQNIDVSLGGFSLPAGLIGEPYAGFNFKTLLSVTGDAGYTGYGVKWSVASGRLPDGLTLGSDGALTGTPTVAGTSNFQLLASYKTKAGQQAYRVVIADITVALSSASLPAGQQGAAYTYDLKSKFTTSDPAYSGAGVTWRLAAGSLPEGLSLSADGVIAGTPTAASAGAPFTVQVAYKNRSGQQQYAVFVAAIAVTLGTTALPPSSSVGVTYPGWDIKPNLTVSGDAAYAGGGANVIWSITNGALPTGLTLSADGTVAGTQSKEDGINPVTVTATYKGVSNSQNYTMTTGTHGITQYGAYRAWSDGSLASSCNEYFKGKQGYAYQGVTGDGIYRIQVPGATPFDATCDMTTDGGGWTVFQQRNSGVVDFYRTWAEYAAGFGSATTEYWLGNDRLAAMTATGTHDMRIDFQRYTGATSYARYTNFKINPASDLYRLASLTYVTSSAGDSLTLSALAAAPLIPDGKPAGAGIGSSPVGMAFSTKDADHDTWSDNCAVTYHGAWWYAACHMSNLNGAYYGGPHSTFADGIEWYSWTGYYESLTRTSMKVR